MNYKRIVSTLGVILIFIGISMLLPIVWSLYYGEHDWYVFLLSSAATYFTGLAAYKLTKKEGNFYNKEAYVVVAFGWFFASLFGAIPYLLTGTFTSFADAFFETMSGFTTTGASVLSNIEGLSHGILFWRSLTHWLGGMGIIVLFVALLSSMGAGGFQMFKAESPGSPLTEKIKPRISETAKILWSIYLIFTITETLLLWLAGMSLFDAFCHTFGTLATGGFSTKNASVGYYNSLIQWIIIFFMFLSGVNFALYYQVFRGKSLKYFWKNGEFRVYLSIIIFSILFFTFNLAPINGSFFLSLRQAAFQVISIVTTTGYVTADFATWPFLLKAILVALMFVGGCSASTGGSIKVGRIMLLLKQSIIELQRAIHPKAILDPKIDGKKVKKEVLLNTQQFFFMYIGITAFSTIVMSASGMDLISAFTSVAATLGNVGPGLAMLGPTENYGFLSDIYKYFLSILMLLGRLELYTVLVLFVPSFWKK